MTVPAASEAKTVDEFIALARRNAGKTTYGSAGNGTPPHLNAEFFKAAQGLDIVHVPYKGAAPAMIDLVAGRIDLMFLNIGSAKAQVESGTLRGLAVSGTARAPTLPNCRRSTRSAFRYRSSIRERGGVLPHRPVCLRSMKQQLNTAIRDALADPDLREKLAKLNVDPTPSSAAEFERTDQARNQEMGRRDQARQDHRGLASHAIRLFHAQRQRLSKQPPNAE